MKTNNLRACPKIHLACANDGLRPIMSHVLIAKGEVVASDGHMLVILKTESVFEEEFIYEMPERFLIHRDSWTHLVKKHKTLKYMADAKEIAIIYDSHIVKIPAIFEEVPGALESLKYPNYTAILNQVSESVDQIGLKPCFLHTISKIFESKNVFLKFNGASNYIDITPSDCCNNARAILMPETFAAVH